MEPGAEPEHALSTAAVDTAAPVAPEAALPIAAPAAALSATAEAPAAADAKVHRQPAIRLLLGSVWQALTVLA